MWPNLCFISCLTGPPDPPTNVNILNTINRQDYVNVTWTLGKSNGSPIRKVIIQCTTQFSPHSWETIAEETDPHKGWTQISLSPWRRYTFRAIAVNGIGNSTPSSQSSSFQAPSTGRSFVYFLQITGYWEREILIRAIGFEFQKLFSKALVLVAILYAPSFTQIIDLTLYSYWGPQGQTLQFPPCSHFLIIFYASMLSRDLTVGISSF